MKCYSNPSDPHCVKHRVLGNSELQLGKLQRNACMTLKSHPRSIFDLKIVYFETLVHSYSHFWIRMGIMSLSVSPRLGDTLDCGRMSHNVVQRRRGNNQSSSIRVLLDRAYLEGWDRPSLVCASWGGSGGGQETRDDGLLDNIEITSEERREIAERLKKRRLKRRQGGAVRRDDVQIGLDDEQVSRAATRREGRRSRRSRASSSQDSGISQDNEVYDVEYEDSYFGWGQGSSKAAGNSWDAAPIDDSGGAIPEDEPTSSSNEYQDTSNFIDPPDIVILSPDELDRVLPVLPFAAQADYFTGGAAQAVQRWGASLALTVLFSKAALLAATSLTWPLWWPWARAANRNYGIRSKMEYGGIWRTRILEIEKGGRPRARFGDLKDDTPKFSMMKTSRIVVGEENGAQTELVLPYDARFDVLQIGEVAEVVVLSNSTSFSDIKAIKDVYLPDSGLWLSEYPYIDRAEFLEISLDVEREISSEYR
jgi:hypothetical protein